MALHTGGLFFAMKLNFDQLEKEILSLVEGESNLIANLSNIAASIKENTGYHWVGFYLVDEKANQLVLGPFQGPIACTRINYNSGVCGTAWAENKTLVVGDVHQFPGHIACSAESNSELVVPITYKDKIVAVLDIDSKNSHDFGPEHNLFYSSLCSKISTLWGNL